MLLVAVVVRVPFAVAVTERDGFNWRWGGEVMSVAAAIVEGQGFASPYFGPTGPTAQQPPVYPHLVAAVARGLGGDMEATVRVMLGINVLLSALTSLVLAGIGGRLVYGWGWALLPLLGWTEAAYVWSTALSTLCLAVLVWMLLQLPRRIGICGLMAGLALLLDPAHVVVLALVSVGLTVAGRLSVRELAVFASIAAAAVSPWAMRNTIALGGPTFLRSNAAYEIRRGLATGPADVALADSMNPGQDRAEFGRFQSLGERGYMAEQSRLVTEMVVADPTIISRRVGQRFVAFWAGTDEVVYNPWPVSMPKKHALFTALPVAGFWGLWVLWRTDRRSAFVLGTLVLVFPLPYYVALTMPRYRAPIEPVLVLLAVYGALSTHERLGAGRRPEGSLERVQPCKNV